MAESIAENSLAAAATMAGAQPPESSAPAVSAIDAELAGLPKFARGLLQIRVPLQVTLASQRKSILDIVELGPGSIIKFDKTCDEPMELAIGNRTIARGEVVKVGDKFGLRLSTLVK